MDQKIIDALSRISDEEQAILDGDNSIRKNIYTEQLDFIIDSEKLLASGRLIDVRTHTRFTDFPMHRHNYTEMLYMVSGSLTTEIKGAGSIILREGDLLMLSQNAEHSLKKCGKDDICANFIILPEFFSRPVAMIGRQNVLSDFMIATLAGHDSPDSFLLFHTKGIVPLENLIENLLWSLIVRRHGMNTINQVTMGLILMNLSELSGEIRSGQSGKKQHILLKVLEYIDQNYAEGTLEECADETGYSIYYLSRLLKSYTGQNFKQLLQQRKLQQAVYYLENTNLSTDVIMSRIGYDNSSYFYNIFRRRYGCSPREYRLTHKL